MTNPKPTPEEQSKRDAESQRREINKISKATNGYVIKAFPDTYVFGRIDEVIEFVREFFGKK